MKTYAIDNGQDYSDHDISFYELPDDVTKEDLEAFFKIFRPNYSILFVSKNIEWCYDGGPNQWCDCVYNPWSHTPPDRDTLKNIHSFFLEQSLKDIEDAISYDQELITKWTLNNFSNVDEAVSVAKQRIEQSEKIYTIISKVLAERKTAEK